MFISDLNILENTNLLKLLLCEDYGSLSEFSCPVCFSLVYKKQIFQCKEGHIACKDCWIDLLSKKNECFRCRLRINSFNDLARCIFIENSFSNKKIKCSYSLEYHLLNNTAVDEPNIKINQVLLSNDQAGCNEIIKIGDIETHLLNCQYRFMKCDNPECDQVFRFKELDNHSVKCQYRKVTCDLCRDIFYQKDLNEHVSLNCPLVFINCIYCGIKFVRKSKNQHIQDECPNVIVECKYKEFGCTEIVKRSEIQAHLNKSSHLYYMNCLIENQSKEMNSYKLEIKNLLNKIQLMEKQVNDQSIKIDQQKNFLDIKIDQQKNLLDKIQLLEKQVNDQSIKIDQQNNLLDKIQLMEKQVNDQLVNIDQQKNLLDIIQLMEKQVNDQSVKIDQQKFQIISQSKQIIQQSNEITNKSIRNF